MAGLLNTIEPANDFLAEHHRQARTLLDELQRIEKALKGNEQRMRDLVASCGSTLTELPGIGQVVGATIIGAVADIDRFDSHNALAAFAGAAPRQIASAGHERHRLNRNGDCRMRYARNKQAI